MLVDLILTLAAGGSALLIFLYYWRKGQFDDMEDVKYQMFRDEEEEKSEARSQKSEGGPVDTHISESAVQDKRTDQIHRSSSDS